MNDKGKGDRAGPVGKRVGTADSKSTHGLTRENIVRALPIALQQDKNVVALAETFADALANRLDEIDKLRIYPSIDELPDDLLDILAYDFKVDWWDPGYTIEQKRETLKSSWMVHRKLGTRAAVETAIRAIYPETTISEWFEYDGEPYHFKLDINMIGDNGNLEKRKRVLERVEYYKSLRSHNDGISYFMKPSAAVARAGTGIAAWHEIVDAALALPVPEVGGRAKVYSCAEMLGGEMIEKATAVNYFGS